MNTWKLKLLASIVVLVAGGCFEGPKVIQGTVVSYDDGSKALVVKDELPPNSEFKISVASADIGATPTEKDVVRVAYKDRGGSLEATKVMNLTRQKELKSSGGH